MFGRQLFSDVSFRAIVVWFLMRRTLRLLDNSDTTKQGRPREGTAPLFPNYMLVCGNEYYALKNK